MPAHHYYLENFPRWGAVCHMRNRKRTPYWVSLELLPSGKLKLVVGNGFRRTCDDFEEARKHVYAPDAIETVDTAGWYLGLNQYIEPASTGDTHMSEIYRGIGGDGTEPMYLNDGVWLKPNGEMYTP